MRDSKDRMRLSGGQSLAVGSTAAIPLFSSLREENVNESRHSTFHSMFATLKNLEFPLLRFFFHSVTFLFDYSEKTNSEKLIRRPNVLPSFSALFTQPFGSLQPKIPSNG